MCEQNNQEQQIQGLLDSWKGQTILVIKEELDNIDQAYMHLEDVRIKEIERDTDDYLANRFLELIGGGETVEQTSEEPLPYSGYDIPLDGVEAVKAEGNQLTFRNHRASYTVQPI